jgi:hypothetical protein
MHRHVTALRHASGKRVVQSIGAEFSTDTLGSPVCAGTAARRAMVTGHGLR